MGILFVPPTPSEIRDWCGDHELAYVAHLGQQPIGQDTEMLENALGVYPHVYKVFAECTVYIDSAGLLQVEFYEGSISGNPEDGERIITYWLQCTSVLGARAAAQAALEGNDWLFTGDYWAVLGFAQTVA